MQILKHIIGFRSARPWKMVIAGLYYFMAIVMITSGIGLMLFTLSIPYVIFNLIAVFRNKKRGLGRKIPLVSFGLAFIIMVTGANLIPSTEGTNIQAGSSKENNEVKLQKDKTATEKRESSPIPVQGEQPTKAAGAQGSGQMAAENGNRVKAYIIKVVDGDTFEIEGGKRVRLIGIDTAESVHPDAARNTEFGNIAGAYTKNMLTGKYVYLEKDVSETDRYGRLLRYVYLEDGTFYNELLVKEGMAQPSTYPPDVKYADLFVRAQQYARENNKGLWALSTAPTEVSQQPASNQTSPAGTSGGTNQPAPASPTQAPVTPSQGASSGSTQGQYVDANGNGLIKGNISSTGEKIYHMPGGASYSRTVPEELFKTEADAQAAGYRRAQR